MKFKLYNIKILKLLPNFEFAILRSIAKTYEFKRILCTVFRQQHASRLQDLHGPIELLQNAALDERGIVEFVKPPREPEVDSFLDHRQPALVQIKILAHSRTRGDLGRLGRLHLVSEPRTPLKWVGA